MGSLATVNFLRALCAQVSLLCIVKTLGESLIVAERLMTRGGGGGMLNVWGQRQTWKIGLIAGWLLDQYFNGSLGGKILLFQTAFYRK